MRRRRQRTRCNPSHAHAPMVQSSRMRTSQLWILYWCSTLRISRSDTLVSLHVALKEMPPPDLCWEAARKGDNERPAKGEPAQGRVQPAPGHGPQPPSLQHARAAAP